MTQGYIQANNTASWNVVTSRSYCPTSFLKKSSTSGIRSSSSVGSETKTFSLLRDHAPAFRILMFTLSAVGKKESGSSSLKIVASLTTALYACRGRTTENGQNM
ncbi:hypothetical protein EYF80_012058 [Liparis tanakae]|uniref:Uncharacterized protein n=1 Tax=Liparis tanakae TaxID=230148 RepID=A0A4Z2IIE8_9TELE|nr:hypothetical protein EYF80_012058 [Liparis tanakae]